MTKQKDWEKEFDEKFVEMHFCIEPILYTMKFEDIDRIKNFINSLLTQQKKEIVEMIENLRDEPLPFSADEKNPIKHCYQNEGYIKALEIIINLLTKENE